MLREIKSVRQNEGEKKRRWFTDDYWDLYVWLEDSGEIYGFQLCYAKYHGEHALTWIRGQGTYHSKVDNRLPFAGDRSSPILVADGFFDKSKVADLFRTDSREIEPGIRNFVLEKIAETDFKEE